MIINSIFLLGIFQNSVTVLWKFFVTEKCFLQKFKVFGNVMTVSLVYIFSIETKM